MADTEQNQGAGTNMMHSSILRVIEDKKNINQKLSNIKHKIGVYSAKGGVGKTTVAVNTAFTLSSMGYKVGLIDADIDCPNTLMFLGIKGAFSDEYPLKPAEKDGVKVVSTSMFVDDVKKPIIWRGPLVAKMIREFLDNTDWGPLDYLIIDLPPGTSDAPLSIIQLLSLDGFLLVTTPRHISAVNTIRSGMMAKRLGVALLGVVENMSDGSGNGGEEVAAELGCDLVGKVTLNKIFGEMSDSGRVPVLHDSSVKQEFENMVRKAGLVTK